MRIDQSSLSSENNTIKVCLATSHIRLEFVDHSKSPRILEWLHKLKQILPESIHSTTNFQMNLIVSEEKLQYYYSIFEHSAKESNNLLLKNLPQNNKIKIKEYKNYILLKIETSFAILDTSSQKIEFVTKNKKLDSFFLSMIKYFVASIFVYFYDLFVMHGNIMNVEGENVLITNIENSGKTSFSLLFWTENSLWLTDDISYVNEKGEFLVDSYRDHTNIRIGSYNAFLDKLVGIEEYINTKKDEEYVIDFDYFRPLKEVFDNKIKYLIIPEIKNGTMGTIVEKKQSNHLNIQELSFNESSTVQLFELFFRNYNRLKRTPKFLKDIPIFNINTDFGYLKRYNSIIKQLRE